MNVSLRTLAVVISGGILFGCLCVASPAEPPETPGSHPEPAEPAADDLADQATHDSRGSLRDLELPDSPIPAFEVPPVESLPPGSPMYRTFQAFRDAAEGRLVQGGTGEPMADDILNVVRTSSTVLANFPNDPLLDTIESEASPNRVGEAVSRRAIAAEQLLRAARMLEKYGEGDSEQLSLIRQMRSEAKRLLPTE